jgi:hypothetical protein
MGHSSTIYRASQQNQLAALARSASFCVMCNLYSHTSGPAALRAIIRSMRGDDSNMLGLPFIYPDRPARRILTDYLKRREMLKGAHD